MTDRRILAANSFNNFLSALVIQKDITMALSHLTNDFYCGLVGADGVVYDKKSFECFLNDYIIMFAYCITGFNVNNISCINVNANDISIMADITLNAVGCVNANQIKIYQSVLTHNISPDGEEVNYKISYMHLAFDALNLDNAIDSKGQINNYLFRSAWDYLEMPVCITDNERRVIYLNRKSLETLKKPMQDCIGKPCKDVWNYDICGTQDCGIECLKNGKRQTSILSQNKKVKVDVMYLKSAMGKIIGHIEIGDDVTYFEEMAERFYSLSENMPGGVCQILLDDEITLIYGNDIFFDIYNCTRELMQHKYDNKIANYLSTDRVNFIKKQFYDAKSSGSINVEYETLLDLPTEKEKWLLVRANIVKNGTAANIVIIDISDRKLMERELRLSEECIRSALEKSSKNVFDYDLLTKQMVQSDNIAEIYGMRRSLENVPESILASGIICRESEADFYQMYQEIFQGKPTATRTIKVYTKHGEIRINKFSLTNIFDQSGKPVRAIGIVEDITQQQNLEKAYLQEEQYLGAMLLNVLIYLEMNLTKDTYSKRKGSGNIKFEEDADKRFSVVLKASIEASVEDEYKDEYYELFCAQNAVNAFENGKHQLSLDHKRRLSDGSVIWASTTMNMIRDLSNGDIKGFIFIKDIDKTKKAEISLKHASIHDALTGVLNKVATEDFIRNTLLNEGYKQHAFIILDVDHFKKINDTFGHYMGDCILVEVAQRLKMAVGDEGVIGRIGGDEFVMFIKHVKESAAACTIAERVCGIFGSALSGNKDYPMVSCSLGIAVSGNDGNTFEELYKNADIALYEAKKMGRNRYVQYCKSKKNTS